MSLEQKLIKGAYGATGADTEGIVAKAQGKMFSDIIDDTTDIVKAQRAKKDDEKSEQEKLQKQKDDLVKDYDANWESTMKQYIDDGGLPIETWKNATEQSKKFKIKHDACPMGKEGDQCRREVTMELRGMATEYSGANDVLGSIVNTQKKINGEYIDPKTGERVTLNQSNYDLQSLDGIERKAIRSGLTPGNSASRMKNDDKIAELREELKNVNPKDPMSGNLIKFLNQEIEALEKSNKFEAGWDTPTHGFISRNDDRLANLYTFTADEVSLNILDRKEENEKDDYKNWDMADTIYAYENSITPENIASIYYDNVTGPGGILKDNLREHPMLKGATYKSLGISGEDLKALDTDLDGIISDDEIEAVIQALADPKHPNYNFKTSQAVAAEYMALNENIERKKHLKRNGLLEETEQSGFNIDDYEK